MRRRFCSPVDRHYVNLGAPTANTTINRGEMNFDRETIIREIWLSASDVPVDADGVITIAVHVYDSSEAADDVIVAATDMETLIVAADKAYKLTLATEDTEIQNTVYSGDTLRFVIVSNSAAIDTSAYFNATVLYQVVEDVTG
jgi:hypothetical protein